MKNIQDITPADVKQAYKGKIGCMCGCRGKHYTEGPMLTKILRTLQANEDLVELDPTGDWVAAKIGSKEHCIYLNA